MQLIPNDSDAAQIGDDAGELFNSVPCGLLVLAPDGTIRAVNDTFLKWTRHDRATLVGARKFDELLTIPSRIYFETHYSPLLRIQGFVNEVAVDILCGDRGVLPAFVNTVEKRGADDAPVLLRVAVFAATDRRAYERELLLERRNSEQAAKAKAEFLAMFAHEIRNPLNAVVVQVDLLQRRNLPPEHGNAIARLRRSVDKVLALLNNMLDISRLDAGKLSLEETDFELADVLHAAVRTVAPIAEGKGLPLEVHVGPGVPPRLCGDPVKLDQALTNLMGNAVKFTETGHVTIGADQIGGVDGSSNIRLWVRDTGMGIPANRQLLIFEEYEQGDPTVGRRFGGTGLGLAITRKLVELMGGRLQVDSEPGRGSTFWFEVRFKIARPVEQQRAV